MSSGCYFPPPVRMVEIPKPGGKGVRVLGVPTVADRIAQTVAAMYLEPEVEPIFHPDSYGYRPRSPALDAVGACRERCWRTDWVIDLDIRGFFDNLDHDLVLKAVAHHTPTSGGSCCMCSGGCKRRCSSRMARWSPGIAAARRARRSHRCWRTCSCTTRSMPGWPGSSRPSSSSGTAMTWWSTAAASRRPSQVRDAIADRLAECGGLELHPDKTRIVYCKDGNAAWRITSTLVHVPGVRVPVARLAERRTGAISSRLPPGRQRRGAPSASGPGDPFLAAAPAQ